MALTQLVAISVAAPPITAMAFAPGGEQVLLGSQAGIEVHSWPELTLKSQLPTELDHVHDLAFSPDGCHLLVAGGAPAEEGVVEVRRWPDGGLLKRISSHGDLVVRVAWSPDGTLWSTASADGTCQLFAVGAEEPSLRYQGHSRGVLATCFLPDSQSVISAGVDQTIQMWDARAGNRIRTFSNHSGSVNDVAIKPSMREATQPTSNGLALETDRSTTKFALPVLASAGDDRTVRLWQPTIGRLVRFARLPSIPGAIAWTREGEQLLAGCDDGSVRILDGESLEVLDTIQALHGPVYAVGLEPSGLRAIAGGAGAPSVVSW